MTDETAIMDETVDWWGMLRDADFLADPAERLAALRAQGPVHFDPESGCYFVLSHDAFTQAMRNPAIGRDTRQWKGGWYSDPDFAKRDPVAYELFSLFQPQMVNVDGPDHKRMRGVYDPAFRARAITEMTAMVEEETDALIATLPTDGTPVDLIAAYARPLPLHVLCRLFEIPKEMAETVAGWSASLIQLGDLMMTDAQKAESLDALKSMRSYLAGQMADCPSGSETSLMRLSLAALEAGVMDRDETLTNFGSFLIAGHETTVTLLGNGLMLLLENPDQMALLRDDPELARRAVDEALRFEPGGNLLLRIALEDCEIAGTKIPGGSPVIGLIRATNRDPDRFEAPNTFDITRSANAHHGFGGGPHFCLGAPLARLQGRLAFQRLVAAFDEITLLEPPGWLAAGTNARVLDTLRVRLTPASSR
ncbi:cytochrome P450 [Jannaschia sp.]|nr:cytochrome P450 [Jannaschia sp.]